MGATPAHALVLIERKIRDSASRQQKIYYFSTYLRKSTRIPVHRRGLATERDWLRPLSTNISVGELVQRSRRLHRTSGSESTSRTSKGRDGQQKLSHGQQPNRNRSGRRGKPSSPYGRPSVASTCLRKLGTKSENTKGYVFNFQMRREKTSVAFLRKLVERIGLQESDRKIRSYAMCISFSIQG